MRSPRRPPGTPLLDIAPVRHRRPLLSRRLGRPSQPASPAGRPGQPGDHTRPPGDHTRPPGGRHRRLRQVKQVRQVQQLWVRPVQQVQQLWVRQAQQLRLPGRPASRLVVALLLVLTAAGPAAMADRPDPSGLASSAYPGTTDPAAALADRADALETAARSTRAAPGPAQLGPGSLVPRAAAPEQSPPPPEPEPEPEPAPEPPKEEEPAEPEPPKEEGPPAPVGGLDQRQMEHAATIVRVGQELGLPERAYVVALATAMQESTMRVLASSVLPESFSYPYDGVGSDHDSVGLFQQRPSMGWGSVADCMDPATSARTFYVALQQVPGWQNLPVTVAAQTVQVSAFPDHYAKHEPLAWELVAALG